MENMIDERTEFLIRKCKLYAQTFSDNKKKEEWYKFVDSCIAQGNNSILDVVDIIEVIEGVKNSKPMAEIANNANCIEVGRLMEAVAKFCPNGQKTINGIIEVLWKGEEQQLQQPDQGIER